MDEVKLFLLANRDSILSANQYRERFCDIKAFDFIWKWAGAEW